MSLSLYHRLQFATHTETPSYRRVGANKRGRPTLPPSPSSLRPETVQQIGPPDASAMVWLPRELHRDTDATPTCASHSHPMQMEYRFTCDYVFQICSAPATPPQSTLNTNFTDFEAGVAVFFSRELHETLKNRHPIPINRLYREVRRLVQPSGEFGLISLIPAGPRKIIKLPATSRMIHRHQAERLFDVIFGHFLNTGRSISNHFSMPKSVSGLYCVDGAPQVPHTPQSMHSSG